MTGLSLAAALVGCDGKPPASADDNGWVDEDGDGYEAYYADCDDADPAIHPGAEEEAGNGIDEDCDCLDIPTVVVTDDELVWKGDVALDWAGQWALAPAVTGVGYQGVLLGATQGAESENATGWGRGVFVAADGGVTVFDGRSSSDERWHGMGSGVAVWDVGEWPSLVVGRTLAREPIADINADNAGTVHVYRLPVEPGTFTPDEDDVTLRGSVGAAACGYALDNGDVTGDGVEDLVVTCPGIGGPSGFVLVEDGTATGTDRDTYDSHARYWENFAKPTEPPEQIQSRIGARTGGDLTGDGHPDLVVSTTGLDGMGSLVIISGPVPVGDHELASEILRIAGSTGDATVLIPTAYDITGDSVDELIVGQPTAEDRRGAVWTVPGPVTEPASLADSEPLFVGACETEWFGYSSVVGDFDGDGVADLAVGAPQDYYYSAWEPGHVYVFLGPDWARADEPAGADFIVQGASPFDGFGFNLAVADVDADGLDDLFVSAPWESRDVWEGGRVYLLRAGTDGFMP